MNIKKVLDERGLQVKDVAAKLKCSAPALSQVLTGNPTTTKLKDIAKAVGCGVWEFFADEINPQDVIRRYQAEIDAEVQHRVELRLAEMPSPQQEEVTRIEKESSLGVLVCPKCGAGIKIKVEEEKHDVEA